MHHKLSSAKVFYGKSDDMSSFIPSAENTFLPHFHLSPAMHSASKGFTNIFDHDKCNDGISFVVSAAIQEFY